MGFGWIGTFILFGLVAIFVALLASVVLCARKRRWIAMWLSLAGAAIVSYPLALMCALAYATCQIIHGQGSFF